MNKSALTRLGALATAASFLAGCATHPDKISANYVSPAQYQSMNCNQLEGEMRRVSGKVHEIAGVQEDEAGKDAVAMGVGLVLFWPALFFLIGSDKERELAQLKGEYEALQQQANMKECGFVEALEEEERRRREAEAEAEAEESQRGFNGAPHGGRWQK